MATSVEQPGAVGHPAVTGAAGTRQGEPVRRPETPAERRARRTAYLAAAIKYNRETKAVIAGLDARYGR